MSRLKIVEVKWLDANTFHYDEIDEGKFRPSQRYSVGYLHERKKGHIVLADALSDSSKSFALDASGAFFTTIPTGMIQSVRFLK